MWKKLTKRQRIQFEEYCDQKYGVKRKAHSQSREPVYFDENTNKIDTKIIYDLLFISPTN